LQERVEGRKYGNDFRSRVQSALQAGAELRWDIDPELQGHRV
jgi:hypothetical protein